MPAPGLLGRPLRLSARALFLGVSVPVVALAVAGYLVFARPWMRTWGATEAEARMALPGDEIVAAPTYQATNAITIDAPAERVWPWLALPLVVTPPALVTRDPNGALAGFLAVGITTLGGLMLGRRWWAVFPAVATGVLAVLLLAPDTYAAFGLVFDVLALGGLGWLIARRGGVGVLHGRRPTARAIP
jgi:hypothetical protein